MDRYERIMQWLNRIVWHVVWTIALGVALAMLISIPTNCYNAMSGH